MIKLSIIINFAFQINELDGAIVSLGVGCLVTGILIRIVCTVIVAIRCRLNLKEKFFVALSWMSKATVQVSKILIIKLNIILLIITNISVRQH